MISQFSDNRLIEEIANGNKNAFEELVMRHTNYAYTIAFRIINISEDAEEVVQDCFLKLSQRPDKFKGDSKFSTWFYRVVTNAALSRIRKKKLKQESIDSQHESVTGDSDPSAHVQQDEQSRLVNLAIGKLKPEERTLITLYYLKEFEQDEIAEMLKIEKGSVKVKIFRARKKLAEILKHFNKEEILTS